MNKKSTYKAPNNAKLKEFAKVFVQREISNAIGEAGIDACFIIGIQLDKILPQYRLYADLVRNAAIELDKVKAYFGGNWYRLSNGQRRSIEAFIHSEVNITNKLIEAHIAYLEHNRNQMNALGPKADQVMQEKMRQILGWSEEEQEGEVAA